MDVSGSAVVNNVGGHFIINHGNNNNVSLLNEEKGVCIMMLDCRNPADTIQSPQRKSLNGWKRQILPGTITQRARPTTRRQVLGLYVVIFSEVGKICPTGRSGCMARVSSLEMNTRLCAYISMGLAVAKQSYGQCHILILAERVELTLLVFC